MHERLLVRHFLQRFVENDLISPDADRHEALAVIGGVLASTGLFVTVLLAAKYEFNIFMPPGVTEILALDDTFLYVGGSMLVMALAAVALWDALSLDARDASILGSLPLRQGVIVRAKLAAVLLAASGFAMALNLVPILSRPALLPLNVDVGVGGGLRLMFAHGISALAAGGFGFLAILALREVLRAVTGPRWFARVSPLVQCVLILALATGLLLLPARYAGVASSWLAPGGLTPFAIPPLWFVGLHETVTGGLIDGRSRDWVPLRMLSADREATALYRSRAPLLTELGTLAIVALGVIAFVALLAFVWNGRRLPETAARRPQRPPIVGAWFARVSRLTIAREPEVQAGFFFALQSLTRSTAHRLIIATATATGLALVALSLRGLPSPSTDGASSVPLALLAVQPVLMVAVMLGLRQAVRIPAGLQETWIFQLCWSGNERSYVVGVKRAVLTLVSPVLLVLSGWHAWSTGPWVALVHLLFALPFTILMAEIMFLGIRQLPFVSRYIPSGRVSLAGLASVLLFVAVGYAWLERLAMDNPGIAGLLVGSTIALLPITRWVDRRRARSRVPIDLDEGPGDVTQRLELIR